MLRIGHKTQRYLRQSVVHHCLCWLVLASVLCFVPMTLLAQPFDLARARRAVVRVIADGGNSIGSGSIIKIDGAEAYILTAYHVIQQDVLKGVSQVRVELFTEEVLEARISRQRIDTANDIAVLIVRQLPSSSPSAIPWDSTVAVWDTQVVYALGHPMGGPRWAVTNGTVSGTGGGKIYFSGTAVSQGNSGGPLLNDKGAFVGMNVNVVGGSGIALTANLIQALIHGWISGWPESAQVELQRPPQPPSPPSTPAQQPAQVVRGKDSKEMRLVPAGWFEMGSTDAEIEEAYQLAKKYYKSSEKSWFENEKGRHRVWVDAFYMDTYEVTMKEYQAFQQATGHPALPAEVTPYAPGENHPVVGVSWDDAATYCRWAEKQLPTEAQWEKAARGTDGRTYPWGSEQPHKRLAQYEAQGATPVGSFDGGKSPYGIHDLAGNVWEWVRDWYDPQYYRRSPERNPENTTAAEYRVLRGGGWDYHGAANLRAAHRGWYAPAARGSYLGFRCVVEVSAPRK
jgi:formylglycine-generating enzyme required for sulfatase activity